MYIPSTCIHSTLPSSTEVICPLHWTRQVAFTYYSASIQMAYNTLLAIVCHQHKMQHFHQHIMQPFNRPNPFTQNRWQSSDFIRHLLSLSKGLSSPQTTVNNKKKHGQPSHTARICLTERFLGSHTTASTYHLSSRQVIM